jgi:hypothetical protein
LPIVFALAGDSTMISDVPRSEPLPFSGVSFTVAGARRRAGALARLVLVRVRVVAPDFPVRFVAMVF